MFAHPAPAPVSASVAAGTRSRGRFWRLVSAGALVGLAQVAAILVALGLAWRTPPSRPDARREGGLDLASHPVPIRVTTPVTLDAEIPEGSLKLLRTEGTTGRVVDVTPPEMNTGSDIGMVWLNLMESVATPQVAAR